MKNEIYLLNEYFLDFLDFQGFQFSLQFMKVYAHVTEHMQMFFFYIISIMTATFDMKHTDFRSSNLTSVYQGPLPLSLVINLGSSGFSTFGGGRHIICKCSGVIVYN